MKWAAVLFVFSFMGFAQSNPPQQVRRSCYQSYVAPIVQRVVYAEPVEVSRDYYYSIDSSYRDKILVDAIVGRLVTLELTRPSMEQLRQARESRQPEQLRMPTTEDINTEVSPIVKKVVEGKCIKCHNTPERVSFANLATVPASVRWHAHGLVNSGEMPKGGTPLTDEEVLAFYDWAKQGSKAVATTKRSR